jgi:cytochrome c oxidase assembly factor CtaG
MVQHVGIALVVAPLLLLGAPLRLALRASGGPTRRALAAALTQTRLLSHPLVAWTLFNATVLSVHLWGLGVRNPLLHGLEHAALFWTAVLFWLPLVGATPVPYRLGPLGALAYLMSAMPVMVAIGMWLGGAAGAIMLAAGAAMTLAAVIGVVWPALLREEARQRVREGVAL